MAMRRKLLLILFFVSQTVLAEKHEIGLTLGGLLSQDRGSTPNALRYIHRGAFDFGAGLDTKLRRWIGARGEIRDFYTGSPAYNLPGITGGQHNVVASGGFVLKWGE